MTSKLGLTVAALIIVVALVTACGPADAPPTSVPVQPTPTSAPPTAAPAPDTLEWPSARKYSRMVHDPASDRTFLVGGWKKYTDQWDMILTDVWSYELANNRWQAQRELGAESVVSVATDKESARVIVFGRGGPHSYGETWAYDPGADSWQQMNPGTGPKKRTGARMAYDAESDRIVLFGGSLSNKVHFDDTWVYDYNADTWTEMQPEVSPPDRGYHGLVYDPGNDRTLLWGGATAADVADQRVWAYDYNTNTWETQEAPADAPEQRAGYGLFFHPPSDRLIVYGGLTNLDGEMVEETTWAYDYGANSWAALGPSKNPGKRAYFPMVYIPSLDKAMLFSGELTNKFADDISDEVWIFDPVTSEWEEMTGPNP